MNPLLRLARAIDGLSARVGALANALVLIACLISASNAFVRKGFDLSSNAWLEAQWYCFAGMVMLGAAWTLQRNEHVRVDVFYGHLSARVQAWIDILGALLFLLPMAAVMTWLSWPMFAESYAIGEMSSDAGGLLRWPVKLLLPLGFALLLAQGVSEVIKRIAYLQGHPEYAAHYERPRQ
ncbi:MAG TPA: TRAP transporter small permease subunit [Burkholderiales bacterium]|jgi:TRAP-type mannitol/chloroaromatic compound transport system permease small subunit|nr:TRAP transporter small permease subunit [Burkholderiales bacterium]